MEKDKWYKVTSGIQTVLSPWYIKFKEINEKGIIKSINHINDIKTLSNNEDNFGKIGYYTFTLINLSEIQEYLPEGHPDKVLPELLLTNIL